MAFQDNCHQWMLHRPREKHVAMALCPVWAWPQRFYIITLYVQRPLQPFVIASTKRHDGPCTCGEIPLCCALFSFRRSADAISQSVMVPFTQCRRSFLCESSQSGWSFLSVFLIPSSSRSYVASPRAALTTTYLFAKVEA